MIRDIIVILKFYLIFVSNRYVDRLIGIRIRYPCSNTDTLCHTPHIPLDKLYIIDEPIR